MFRPFSIPLQDLKVIWLGGQPHGEYTNGLAYGMNRIVRFREWPGGLQVIAKDLHQQFFRGLRAGLFTRTMFDPTMRLWHEQGMMMLPCSLSKPTDPGQNHYHIWKMFLASFLQQLCQEKPDVILVIAGKHAKAIIDSFRDPATGKKTNYEMEVDHLYTNYAPQYIAMRNELELQKNPSLKWWQQQQLNFPWEYLYTLIKKRNNNGAGKGAHFSLFK